MASKKDRLISPSGTASYPWVRKPDTKFNPKGVYKCKIILDEHDEDTQKFIADLETKRDAVVQELKDGKFQWMGDTVKLKPYQIKELNIHPVYTQIRDDDTGEPTGQIEVTAKQNAVFGKNDEYTANIAVVNSKGQPDATLNVFGGDTIKMCVTYSGFWNAKDQLIGLTIRLAAVQVIESNGSGGGAGGFGFGDEGDGAIGAPASDSPADDFSDEDMPEAGADF